MPRLWNDSIAAHRHDVRAAILEATASLVATHGPLAITMSQVAEGTGIGRATLYKYFDGIESVLVAWHEEQVSAHLAELADIRDGSGSAIERLEAVLARYAQIRRGRRRHGRSDHGHGDHDDGAAVFHLATQVSAAEDELRGLLGDLLAEAVTVGEVRDDVPVDELAAYCHNALAAAETLPSEQASRRLVELVRAGLAPPA